jgi:hypothetical protein
MLTSRKRLEQKGQTIEWDSPDIFIKFCKILSQIKLEFNVCVTITGIENLFNINDL